MLDTNFKFLILILQGYNPRHAQHALDAAAQEDEQKRRSGTPALPPTHSTALPPTLRSSTGQGVRKAGSTENCISVAPAASSSKWERDAGQHVLGRRSEGSALQRVPASPAGEAAPNMCATAMELPDDLHRSCTDAAVAKAGATSSETASATGLPAESVSVGMGGGGSGMERGREQDDGGEGGVGAIRSRTPTGNAESKEGGLEGGCKSSREECFLIS
jgi:hypothetical protein